MTAFQTLNDLFFLKIEEDGDFFYYYNLTPEESMELANERANGYLKQAIAKFWSKCGDLLDIYDFDADAQTFNFDLKDVELDILSNLMIEEYFKSHKAKLRAFTLNFTPSDLQVFSPANERKTFLELYQDLKIENAIMLDNYAGRNRDTGAANTINYTSFSSVISEE